jgi:hypothetical protein
MSRRASRDRGAGASDMPPVPLTASASNSTWPEACEISSLRPKLYVPRTQKRSRGTRRRRPVLQRPRCVKWLRTAPSRAVQLPIARNKRRLGWTHSKSGLQILSPGGKRPPQPGRGTTILSRGTSRACFRGSRPPAPKRAHLSRGTPLSLGWRAVSLPQALGGQVPAHKSDPSR